MPTHNYQLKASIILLFSYLSIDHSQPLALFKVANIKVF